MQVTIYCGACFGGLAVGHEMGIRCKESLDERS